MKLAYWDEDAYVTELRITEPEHENPIKTSAAPAEADSKVREPDKGKKRKAESSSAKDNTAIKKSAPSHLQFWSNRHAELHGIKQDPGSNGSRKKQSPLGRASSSPARPQAQTFSDPERLCCYLCYRQFQSATEVNKHERLSRLHQGNLKNAQLVERAKAKFVKHGIEVNGDGEKPEYRDRARERRKAFGVEKRNKATGVTKPKSVDDADSSTSQSQTKGASLLSKMGFDSTAGKGLGAQGTGMTAPLMQDVYAAGVGLGAQGGKLGDAVKEAERNTKGDYGEFLEKTREGARARYERLG